MIESFTNIGLFIILYLFYKVRIYYKDLGVDITHIQDTEDSEAS